jgi:hypothetical protein
VTRRQRIALWTGIAIVGAAVLLQLTFFRREHPVTLTGVVIRQDSDPGKQAPIIGVEIIAANGLALRESTSDSSGLFHLSLRPGLKRSQPIPLTFRHPDYMPLDLTMAAGNMLYVVRMSPIPRAASKAGGRLTSIAQVFIRYSARTSTAVDIGSAVKTFEVVNTGNIDCKGQELCSPDGKWKATAAAMSLDAGEGNAFRNPVVSCIAGPCPFTRVDSDRLAEDNRVIKVSVRDWSDSATFLVEAEVVHPMTDQAIRQSYPAILGRNLSFTLPAEAEGVSIEAEVNGTRVVFPLGPDLCLSWANCSARVEADHSRTYRCELKQGYEFR